MNVHMHNYGYLRLTDEEFQEARKPNATICKEAHMYLEYRQSKEGYWMAGKFLMQMEVATTIVEM